MRQQERRSRQQKRRSRKQEKNKKIKRLNLYNQTLWLTSDKAVFWEEESSLILADIHLGKAMHFRKSGIPVPLSAGADNLKRMSGLIAKFNPGRIIFLGDLFHSYHNEAWEKFGNWRADYSEISMELVIGNHDIMNDNQFLRFGIAIHDPLLQIGPFIFSHKPAQEYFEGKYNLAGHIHPAVRLSENGRQRLRLPCFWFGENQGLLPAFGNFTGTAVIEPAATDRVFVITKNKVIDVSPVD